MTFNHRTAVTAAPNGQGAKQRVAELQGLRGLALLLVVLFHLFGQGRVSGGVDVFLVVSAFLCTLTVMARLEAGTLDPFRQIGRTLWRLTPPALLVLVVTAVLAVLLLPETRWPEIATQITASAVGMENWELIRSGLSYGAVDPQANPLQHFWSLSVQLQFLVLWPLVMLLLWRLARRAGTAPRPVIAAFVGIGTLASFAYAAHMAQVDPSVGYFSSFTRFWELGAGAALALVFPFVRVGPGLGTSLVGFGLALLISCGFVVDGAAQFPGPWALWPVAAAACVIVGATADSPRHRRYLDNRAWQGLSRYAYALYLWHWPVMVFYVTYRVHFELGAKGALLVLAVSCVLAWATSRCVEVPLQSIGARIDPCHLIAITVSASLFVAASSAGIALVRADRVHDELTLASDRSVYVGAAALQGTSVVAATPRPAPELARYDEPNEEGCIQSYLSHERYDEALVCTLHDGPPGSPHVYLAGGSHIEHWGPALIALAERHGWSVEAVMKQGCRLQVEAAGSAPTSCGRWTANALEVIAAAAPELVLVTGTRTVQHGIETPADQANVDAWDGLARSGIEVVALRDSPRFPQPAPDCLLDGDADTCALDSAQVYGTWDAVQASSTLAHQVDTSDLFCDGLRCSPVIGNVVAYRDADHLTATYARTLDDSLDARLNELGLEIYRR